MLERLGEVVYWIGAGLGALLEISGWAMVIVWWGKSGDWIVGVIVIIAGFIVFGIGRACLYILAAR